MILTNKPNLNEKSETLQYFYSILFLWMINSDTDIIRYDEIQQIANIVPRGKISKAPIIIMASFCIFQFYCCTKNI